ncbi:Hypothetical predicted protein [Mytilus galloprovincialis]|uniref:Uncharacterized protein n=1 Tax=Mytilus galloprovincialis TaxID=29158 RepID=A0A8B6FT11_MYTGA|nr:Hypothetical predicted protein [Mytilus galloprovincialis]
METDVEKLREQTLQMKRFASDLQVFLGTRHLNQALCKTIGSLKEMIRDYTNNEIEKEVNHVISSLMNKVKQFGEIRVSEALVELKLKDAKIDQAQIQIHGLSQNIHNVNLKLKQKFDIKGSEQPISDCIVLPDDRIIIADFYGSVKKLMEYNINGKHIRDIPISNKPFSLTAIDTNGIAVTYGVEKALGYYKHYWL